LGPAAESFCPVCGSSLGEVAAEQQERLEADFRKVAELHAACCFDDALVLLVPISKRTHPRLAEQALRAGQLIRELVAERDRRRAEAEIASQRARKSFDAYDFDGAAEILAQVPSPLRSEATVKLDAQVAARRQEIAALTEEVRAAVREKRILDLASSIDRLLALKPDHPVGGKLAEKVQRHLLDAAEKHLAEHRYDDAQRLLERIPLPVRTPRAKELHRQVGELAWLAWDLRSAPFVDATLLSVAKRLQALAPKDARAVKLSSELQRRTKLAESKPRGKPQPWARPPQATALGVPIEWLSGFRRLGRVETLEQSETLQQTGRFAVACGLALTALGEAAMPINLFSSGNPGVLKWVGGLVRSWRDQPGWGIDLGPSGLKAVQLAWDQNQQQAVIQAVALIEHAKPLSHAANEDEEKKLIEETLEKFLDSHQTKSTQVCLGIPGRMSLMVSLELPPMEPAKLPKLVEYEARSEFPIPLEQLAWDFQVFQHLPADSNGSAKAEVQDGQRALLVGARHTATQRFLEPCERLGLRVDAIQTDVIGLHNLLVYEHFPDDDNPLPPAQNAVAAIDVGCDATNIVVSSPYSLWSHACGVGGQTFTRALVKDLKFGIAQAEQQKRTPESAERLSDLFEAWSPVFQDLLRETRDSLATYAQTIPDYPVRQIIGLGGGFALHGLLRGLRCGR
jgi:Tfp pilus assembly PilM family ATPase